MSQLIQIRHRIKAIQKTQKITRAMRLIAMSLYSKLERQRGHISEYMKEICTQNLPIIAESQHKSPIFFPEDVLDSSPLIIICTSSKSLCGGLNNSLLKFFEKNVFFEDHQRPSFITIGQKASDYIAKKKRCNHVLEIRDVSSSNIEEAQRKILDVICKSEKSYSSVTGYYSNLKNFFVQEPTREQLIPFNTTTENSNPKRQLVTYEQSSEMLAERAAQQTISVYVLHMLFQSYISENAARFIAMDQSSNNAKKYLEALALEYNKFRQSIITREISELSSNLD